jgi:hypothetical protein
MVFDSVYEMTDYLKSPTITPTVTVSDDFSSTSGWTQLDSAKIGIDTSNERLDFDIELQTIDNAYRTIPTGGSTWVMRYKLRFTTLTASSGSGIYFVVDISDDGTTAGNNYATGSIGIILDFDDGNNKALKLFGHGVTADEIFVPVINTDYYVEVLKTGSTTATATIGTDSYGGVANGGSGSITGITASTAQDTFAVRNRGTSSGSSGHSVVGYIKDFQYYNGVTSILPYPKPRGQHFWEYFLGSTLNSRWSSHGSGSASITDDGLLLTSPTNGAQSIDFSPSDAGKIRPFSPTGAVMIVTSKMVQAQYSNQSNGFRTNYYTEAGKYVIMAIQGQTNGNSSDNKIMLKSNNPSTSVDTTIASSAIHDWHTYKLELLSSSSTLNVDGLLQVTGSCNPDIKCQPYLNMATAEGTISGGAKTNYRYCEVYNT